MMGSYRKEQKIKKDKMASPTRLKIAHKKQKE